jgi:hypothetical protein
MKLRMTILSTVLLLGAMGPNVASASDDVMIVSKDALVTGSYCHMKFPAIREETLATAHPMLKEAGSGDIIDFYGSCDHDPLGIDEVQSQKLHLQHRRTRE